MSAPLQGQDALDSDLAASTPMGGMQIPASNADVFQQAEAQASLDPMLEQKRKIVQIVLSVRRDCIMRRASVDRNTFLNAAFVLDNQYVEWDDARRAVVIVPAPRNAVRRTLNLIYPYTRSMESRLSKGQPSYQTKARQDSEDSEDVAELGNDLIPYVERRIRMDKIRHKIAFWMLRAGTCTIWNLWDQDGGAIIADPMTGAPQPGGEPYSDAHPPHEVFYYPSPSTDIDTAQGIGREITIGRAEAVARFPQLKAKLAGGFGVDVDQPFNISQAVRDMQQGQHGWQTQGNLGTLGTVSTVDRRLEDEVRFIQFFLRPGAAMFDGMRLYRFPKGLHLICTIEGEIGYWANNEYGDLPAVRAAFSESSGFWSQAPITSLRPIQMAINWAASLWEEQMILAGRPVMLWPKQAKAMWRRMQDLTNRVLQWVPGPKGGEPKYLNPPNFPTPLPELFSLLRDVFRDVAALHEVSSGQLPASGTSGVAIRLLQDQDDSQIGFSAHSLEVALARIVEQHLDNMRKFMSVQQLLPLANNSPHQARLFAGADLKSGVSVEVVPGSALPKSPAELEAKATEAWLQGWMLDEFGQPDWRRMLVLRGLGSADKLYNEAQRDKNIAALEEERILSLDPRICMLALAFFQKTQQLPMDFMPKPWDDHIVHDAVHRRTRKKIREWELAGIQKYHPLTLQLFEIHMQVTTVFALQQKAGMPTMPGFGANTGQISPQTAGGQRTGSPAQQTAQQRENQPAPAAA